MRPGKLLGKFPIPLDIPCRDFLSVLASFGERIARKERKAAEGLPQIPSQPVS
jgi:hypothetical protein